MINVIVKKFNFESGASGANAVKLAQTLSVTVEYLVTGKNPSPQNSAPQLTDEEIRIYKQNSSLIKKLAQLSPASKKEIEDLLERMK